MAHINFYLHTKYKIFNISYDLKMIIQLFKPYTTSKWVCVTMNCHSWSDGRRGVVTKRWGRLVTRLIAEAH